MKSILIVDDEEKIREVVVSYLEKEGFRTVEAQTGLSALQVVKEEAVDLVVLDLMLPDISGEEVCQQIRKISSVPVLMLTAKVAEEDRVIGLTLGADDYVIKPFSPKELVARVKAILRRSSEQNLLADRISFSNGELVIDTAQQMIVKHGDSINLTPNEYKLLVVLARHPQRSFTREELIEKVFGYSYEGDARTIDQHIKNLRQKIEPDPKQPKYVCTVYGTGYKFVGDHG
ncbi:DNA-binding response OmpR family regulator [Aneurinibacillus soli]|uniref:Sensory transduction protein regX3 n=1 Tax=Aneurinibacillus soli TaxID=1500254 RepID=A0A0U4NHY9_9BACL|nr:response regulator transcription factor [Aneurinibacillus soli]PYE64407.1 DNA-binding response OmpR family regulator [Aneurinibacillus soli]BAU28356.1 Sensory transduction protein regX3 [Aneurinibacillus soli]